MKYEELEKEIQCEDGGFIPLGTNGRILFEILKEMRKMNETLDQWDLARRELEIWHNR